MPLDIEKEHAVETFKSLIHISVEGFKLLAILNGGAAVALLAYLGNVAKTDRPPDMVLPMICYITGLLLCGFAFLGSYLTQFTLLNEAFDRKPRGAHTTWVKITMIIVTVSLVSFAIGSIIAALRFQGLGAAAGTSMFSETLSRTIVRGAETWQFFAFVFGALIVFFYGLVDELPKNPRKAIGKIVIFGAVLYFTFWNAWFRNLLATLLNIIKIEQH